MIFAVAILSDYLPVVMIHGINENSASIEPMAQWIREQLPGVYVLNCDIGYDKRSSLYMTIEKQVDELAACINEDPLLAGGFVGLGYSQGGYLMRGYLELHNHVGAPMKRFVSLSAPLGGFFCGKRSTCYKFGKMFTAANFFASRLVYTSFVQKLVGPSNYWRDPKHLDKYARKCASLPALDNARSFSQQKKDNFESVDLMVLFGSANDGVISPWQSAWFGVWGADDSYAVDMEGREEYQRDLFGLKTMNENGKVVRIESGLKHREYRTNKEYFVANVVKWLDVKV
ncbi:Palmitoyl-protein_thioesterase [Hexamita inflata]|uniref:Palmitoyl-protein thioesterase n=1 Tax=Hexamita inflata TaxID=28002 RepID=A0AA86UZV6_9EUKA|nr:Palmitoyl-protein thioesterase [Hexamita inflata]